MSKFQRDYYIIVATALNSTQQSLLNTLGNALDRYDSDGISVISVNGKLKANAGASAINAAIAETQNSPAVLAPTLNSVFKDIGSNNAGVFAVVKTVQDKAAVKASIIEYSKKLPNADDQFGISFLTVDGADETFFSELDDNLVAQGANGDVVDTKSLSEAASNPNAAIEGLLED